MASGWNVSNATSHWTAVTPSDTVNFTNGECAYIYVGTGGNVTAICDGVAILFTALAIGYHPIRCTRINATGTSASTIVAAY